MIETVRIAVLLLLVLAAVAVAARRIGVPPAILLVLVGVALALVPGLPPVELAPELVLLLVLPPDVVAPLAIAPALAFCVPEHVGGSGVVARFVWVFPATYLPRWLSPSLARRHPAPIWQAPFLIGFTGIRGIVSLAAAPASRS